VSRHLRVNPILCQAHGMCAELLPELIALDEWGYPYLDGRPVPRELVDHAERAAAACPTFALLLERPRTETPTRTPAPAAPQAPTAPVPRRRPRMPDRPPRV
jgi:ferredoxin